MQYRRLRNLLVSLLGLTLLLPLATAWAAEPSPAETTRKWKENRVRLALSTSLFQQDRSIKFDSDVRAAAVSAVSAWTKAADVAIDLVDSSVQNVSPADGAGDGVNLVTVAASAENLALFPKGAESVPAYTRLFFDKRGFLSEADVVLNPWIKFSTDGTIGSYDLESVLLHEIGHVLGLPHSPVSSSKMSDRIAYNGLLPAKRLVGQGLTASDVSSIRGIYGPGPGFSLCCTSIAGRIQGSSTGAVVWAEEVQSGRVAAVRSVKTPGDFMLDGLDGGNYMILTQGAELPNSSVELANDFFELPEILKPRRLGARAKADPKLVGLNGQLSHFPVVVEAGNTYQIFVGGDGLESAAIDIGFSGNFLTTVKGSLIKVDFSGPYSAVALTVDVPAATPRGDYSLFVRSPDGTKRYLIGAISVV